MTKQQDERTTRLEHAVFGNGEKGMDEMIRGVYEWMMQWKIEIETLDQERREMNSKVNDLYEWMNEQKEKVKEEKEAREDDRKYLKRAIITPLIATIVTALVTSCMGASASIMLVINGILYFQNHQAGLIGFLLR